MLGYIANNNLSVHSITMKSGCDGELTAHLFLLIFLFGLYSSSRLLLLSWCFTTLRHLTHFMQGYC